MRAMFLVLTSVFMLVGIAHADRVDLAQAVVVVSDDAGQVPAEVIVEEVVRRTGFCWTIADIPPETGAAIQLEAVDASLQGSGLPGREGYAITTELLEHGVRVRIVGDGRRGLLFGAGRLLRALEWGKGVARLSGPLNVKETPESAIRGHQIGYRHKANTYDAWTPAQYDQYIRELALFGVNSIENIPLEADIGPLMKCSKRDMNRAISGICDRYDLDYWMWAPAAFDLKDTSRRTAWLAEHAVFFADCARLNAVFFPGGDPGDNPPSIVIPYLEELNALLVQHHPEARIWVSLQGWQDDWVDEFYQWLLAGMPDWIGGLVAGPSSPPIADTRARLPRKYGLRHYPDITHTVRAQYPALWLDPALGHTLGREGINPRPVFYAFIHRHFAPYLDGFISYSDGAHDDINKVVMTAVSWDTRIAERDAVLDYTRFHFGYDVAERAADGIFALERNWDGPLASNGSVEGTLALWRALEQERPDLELNWRWQMCLLRAYYDAFTRARLITHEAIEREAEAALSQASEIGPDAAMNAALAVLARMDTETPRPELRERIFALGDALFASAGIQTSVDRHGASDPQRGAILDFVDLPLNNRWWLEDEFERIRVMGSEDEKLARLGLIAKWEHPGPGSYYDDIGNVAKSPHVIRSGSFFSNADYEANPNPDLMWWNSGRSRVRRSWISKMNWPLGLRYEGVDPEARYIVRATGYADCFLRVNGERVKPILYGKEMGEFKEFPVPRRLYRNGVIELTFDTPYEPDINWRQQSRLNEVWLIRQ